MNPLSRIAVMALLLVFPVAAEYPLSAALRGALMSASTIPEESAHMARATAAELLSRHVKIRDGNHLSQSRSGTAGWWMETHGLHLSRVTAQPVSMADKANGIAESYYVSVDAEMYRTYDAKATKWSDWHNGRIFFLPPAIKVVRGTNGEWTANAPTLSNLVAFTGRGNPDLIPHGSKPLPTAKAPSGNAPAPSRHVFPPAPANPIKPPPPRHCAFPGCEDG